MGVVPGAGSLYHPTFCGLKRSRLALLGNHRLQATGFLAGGLRILAMSEVDAHLLWERPKHLQGVQGLSQQPRLALPGEWVELTMYVRTKHPVWRYLLWNAKRALTSSRR